MCDKGVKTTDDLQPASQCPPELINLVGLIHVRIESLYDQYWLIHDGLQKIKRFPTEPDSDERAANSSVDVIRSLEYVAAHLSDLVDRFAIENNKLNAIV